MAAMVTPINNLATNSIQRCIQHCYTLQEQYLEVDFILGSLFERDVIDYHLMQCINSEHVQFKKNRLLINHLCKQDRSVILIYCDILEQSVDSSKCVLPAHALIASAVRKLLSEDVREGSYDEWEEWEKEILCFLRFIDPTYFSKAVSSPSARNPPYVPPTGILASKIHHRIIHGVINLNRQNAEFFIDQIMVKDYPVDLKVALLQVGCNDSERYIPKLESEGLALCRQEDCQNSLILGLRLHTHLAWCYFTIDSEKFRDHLNAALCLQHLVGYDVMFEGLMIIHGASLVYDALQSDSLTSELEHLILNMVIPAIRDHSSRNAVNYGSGICMETAMSDVLFIHIVLAECHKRRGNRHEMTLHMMSMKKLAMKCDYGLKLHSLKGGSETSWFSKLVHILKLPATIEELLECDDPSQLLRCPGVDRSSEDKLAHSQLTTYTIPTKLCSWSQRLVKWVPRDAYGVIFKLFRIVLVFLFALFVHIL